jgi:hypothetical protein
MEEKEKFYFGFTIFAVVIIIILVIYLLNKHKKEQYILKDKF